MTFRSFCRIALTCFALSTVFVLGRTPEAHGQANNGQNNNAFVQPIAGIEIDAGGVLRMRRVDPIVGQQRMLAAANKLPPALAGKSRLRKVSLNRLEAAIANEMGRGGKPTAEMNAVAGLTGIEYVFFYPESGDIVIAGPAEGFADDAAGVTRGLFSGRPTILLEDLVVALRAYAPSGEPTSVISVSIDPTKEGLARMNSFLKSLGGRATPDATMNIAQGLKNNLGLQTVTLKGVPHETHFAQVLVEADYRMKLIGIGLERLPVAMKSYVERASSASIAANSMERWYFVPNYECVQVSEDGLAMRLVGDGVKLMGENERVSSDGQRTSVARVNAASQAFCKDFTENYPKIASAVAVYGQLKTLIDLSIAAAFIRQQDYYGQASWDMSLLGDEQKLPVCTHTAPNQVETAVNAIWKGNKLMTPLGGGVQMNPRMALRKENLLKDEGKATSERASQDLTQLAPNQWWWD